MPQVHATAIVEPGARIAADVSIGPYSCVGPEVELGPGVSVAAHVVIAGRTSIGAGTRIFPFVSLGQPPQHAHYAGEPSRLVIGRDNVIREYVTMNPGTTAGGMITSVGDGGYYMAGSHVGHDCRIGDRVMIANGVLLAGHVEVGHNVVIGGDTSVHQHVRIGSYAMISGSSGILQDVIPFGLAHGTPARLTGLNLVGLRRNGFSAEEIAELRAAYREIFGGGSLSEGIEAAVERLGASRPVQELVAFMRGKSVRRICHPRRSNGA
jgi:UDP-N-acetylglucosamine acyltransferase